MSAGNNVRWSFSSSSVKEYAIEEDQSASTFAGLLLKDVGRPEALNTLAMVPPLIAMEYPTLLCKVYEAQSLMCATVPETTQTVISGAGGRIDEVIPFLLAGRKDILVAEPHREFEARKYSPDFTALAIEHTVVSRCKNLGGKIKGVVLSNDTHGEIIKTFKGGKIDELAIFRMDPDSLLNGGSIELSAGGQDVAEMQYQATVNFMGLLSTISPNGYAIISFGVGYSSKGLLFRLTLLNTIKELGKKAGFMVEDLGSPWIDLYERHNPGAIDSQDPVVKNILQFASVGSIRVHGGKELAQVVNNASFRFYKKVLFNCLATGIEQTLHDNLPQKLGLD